MSIQLKKTAINPEDTSLGHEKLPRPNIDHQKLPRPNIDHLIKRIMTERRKERKINVVTMILILSVIASAALFFS